VAEIGSRWSPWWADHPETAIQHRQEVARLAIEDRRRQLREEEDERRILTGAASVDVVDDRDFYDRAELEHQQLERAERNQPHPNDWARR